jgi:dTMP kinase
LLQIAFDKRSAAALKGSMTGKFITFEGGDGAGKSTQIRRLAAALAATGRKVEQTREPGGTPAAEAVRRLILSGLAESMGAEGEAILFAAARADHVDKVIRPALNRGEWVLCDRFADSTRVYQGGGGADDALLRSLERVAVGDSRPDLTIILDVPAAVGLERARGRNGTDPTPADRFESEELWLQEKRRQAFLDIAEREPQRCVVVDATQSEDEVAHAVWKAVSTRLFDEAAA